MTSSQDQFIGLTAIAIALGGAIFTVDVAMPLGVAAGVPYVALVLLGWWFRGEAAIHVLAVAGSLLTLLGYYYSPAFAAAEVVLANRVMSWMAIWVTAVLLTIAKREQRRVIAARDTLAEQSGALARASRELEQENRERHRAEQSLQGERDKLALVLDNAVHGIISIDPGGIVEYFNPAAERIFGYRAADVLGRNVAMLMPEPHRSRHDDYVANYLRTGQARVIGIGREVEGLRADGTRFPMELSISELRTGDTHRFVGTVQDISARKAAERRIVAETRRAQQYLDVAATLFVALDREGRITLLNRKAAQVLECSEAEVSGQDWFEHFIPPSEREKVRRVFRRAMAGDEVGAGFHENPVIAQRSGKPRRIAWHNAVLRDEGGRAEGILSSGLDVTEQRSLEAQLQQAQKMEAIGQLAGGMAHDMRNVLGAAIGNLEMLQHQAALDEHSRVLVRRAIEAAERSASLTHQLLAFSRKQTLRPQRIDLNQTVASMHSLLTRTLGETFRLRTDLASSLCPVHVDPAQLDTAVLNLAINARDAMPDGGHLVISTANEVLDADYARVHAEVTPGEYAMVAISDTGEGMPPEVAEHVFEPFFTTKEVGQGSGLGLSMVYGFVKQSGGHVKIYSEPGHGTTVRLYFPRADGAGEPAAEEAPAEAPPVRGSREAVLVVEDNVELREVTVDMLEYLGYRPVPAGDAREALALLEREPDVVLLFSDVVLPGGMSGFDLAERARAQYPSLKVLFTSGHTRHAMAHRGMLYDDAELIEKPLRMRRLGQKLREVLDSA